MFQCLVKTVLNNVIKRKHNPSGFRGIFFSVFRLYTEQKQEWEKVDARITSWTNPAGNL